MSEKLLNCRSKAQIIILNILKQLSKLLPSGSSFTPQHTEIIISQICSALAVLSSPARLRIAMYLAEHGAATARILRHKLNLSERRVYSALDAFASIRFARPVSYVSCGRRRAAVWAVEGASEKQIQNAIIEHKRLASVIYRLAEPFIEKYAARREKDVNFRELLRECRRVDVAELVAQELQRRGKRVWR